MYYGTDFRSDKRLECSASPKDCPAVAAKLVVNAFAVLARAGVDLDDVADLNKTWNAKFSSRFNLGWLGDVRRRIALGTWLRVDHFQIHMRRRFQRDGIIVEQSDRAHHSVFEVLPRFARNIRLDLVLLERRRVHEHVIFPLTIQILDFRRFDVGTFQRVAAFVRSIQHRAADEVAHFALVHRVAFTRLHEVHFDNDIRVTIDLDFETFAKIACVVCCHDRAGSVSVRMKKWGLGLNVSPQILTTKDENVPTGSTEVSSGYPAHRESEFLTSFEQGQVDWQQAMRMAIRSASELRRLLNLPPGDEATRQAEASFPTFVSREFLSRMEPGNLEDPLLRQVLPIQDEIEISPGFGADPVGDVAATIAPGLLQKYARRALVITTGVCGVHCRYCFRREFDYSSASKNSEPANEAWESAIKELAAREEIDEVILSGGDPLTLSDTKLERLFTAVEAIPHVKRLRIHSRMPIVIPQRVTERLVDRLRTSRLAAWMVVHCNHAAEIDGHVENAFAKMIDRGIPVLNQAVLLRGVNDSVDVLESLCRRLINLRVQPYYLFQLDRVTGTAHFETNIACGVAIINQLRERLPGYAVPQFVVENAGQKSKTPLTVSPTAIVNPGNIHRGQ